MSRDSPRDGVSLTANERNLSADESRDAPMDRVSVPEAADLLGVTQSAIRKRIQRGTIPWDKDSEGRTFVYVDSLETSHETGQDKSQDAAEGQSRDELLEVYRDQVEFLRRELERKDTLLMSLMQRIPELEAPAESRDASERVSEEGDKGGTASSEQQESEKRRSWLYRFFFGPS